MAEETTHAVYQGKHYVLPGKLSRDEALLRVKNLADTKGPKLLGGAAQVSGFEDTSQDAAAIQERYREPNRAIDVLPRLAEFAAAPFVAGQFGRGAMALRGLGAAEKARRVAVGTAKVAGAAGAGMVANEGLQSIGVPPVVSELAVTLAGLSTKPGRQFLKGGLEALLRRETSEAVPTVARKAATEAAEATAARTAAPPIATPPAAAPPTVGATALQPEPATEAASEIAAKIVEWKTKNKFSGAQIQSALRDTYGIPMKEAGKMRDMVLQANGLAAPKAATRAATQAAAPKPSAPPAAAPASNPDLQAPRVEVGAQNVARQTGMTRDEVRRQAGPVLGEAVGEASPILPKKALQSIIDTMRKIPPGPEREAYVAKATSGKAQWQIENIRRTLEHLGLLVPAGAAGAAAYGRER